jgi:serine/threonine protein kinase
MPLMEFSSFLEYVPGGSIASILRKHGRFSENVTKSFTSQILDGLDYLHSKGIIHRVVLFYILFLRIPR